MQIVYRSLEKHGLSVGALHGDLDQRARMAALDAFRSGAVQLLVCSDVAARGLDIPDVSHVINYDAPHHEEDYVHRIGRTGRAGRSGVSFTIATPHDGKAVAAIEKLIHKTIPIFEGVGAHPDATSAPPEAEEAERDPAARRSRRHLSDGHGSRNESRGRERERAPQREDSRSRGERPRPQPRPNPAEGERAPRPARFAPQREAKAPMLAAAEPDSGVGFGGDDFVPSFLLRPAKPRKSGG